MHGYGVACFTAKCRRRAAAPRRSPFTYSTYPLQTLPPSPFSSLSSLPRAPFVVLSSSPTLSFPRPRAPSPPSPRLPLVGITLFAFPAAGRRVARCLYSRVHSSRVPCMHISIAYSPSLAYRSRFPRMHAALHLPPVARFSRVSPRDDRIRRITTCVFSTSRGEPRSLALTRARISRLL